MPSANRPGGEHLFAEHLFGPGSGEQVFVTALGEHTFVTVLQDHKKNVCLHKSRRNWHDVAAGDSL